MLVSAAGKAPASSSSLVMSSNGRAGSLVAAFLALIVAGAVLSGQQPQFYSDDPIARDDDMALDASKVTAVEDSNGYDFVVNTFGSPGIRHDVRAGNVNTVDQVPDSSWFTNRMGTRRLTTARSSAVPIASPSISLQGWKVSGGQVGRGPARVPHDGPVGADLPDRVRSADEPRDGHRRRDCRHGVLQRLRLPHGRCLPRRARPGRDRDRADRTHHRSAHRRATDDDPPRRRRRAEPRRTDGERPLPRPGQPVRGGQAAGQLPVLRHEGRRSERSGAARGSARAASGAACSGPG